MIIQCALCVCLFPLRQDSGDWLGAFRAAVAIFEGRAVAVTGLPCRDEELSRELSSLLLSYTEQVFSYLASAESHAAALEASTQPVGVTEVDLNGNDAAKEGEASIHASNDGSLGEYGGTIGPASQSEGKGSDVSDRASEVRCEFQRVGRTAIDFCVRVGKQELLFGTVMPQFQTHKQTGERSALCVAQDVFQVYAAAVNSAPGSR